MTKPDERRRFFRIIDAIGVTYEVIEAHSDGEATTAATPVKVNAHDLLQQHNEHIDTTIAKFQQANPEIAEALIAINQKVDTLMAMIELDDIAINHAVHRVAEASISASGIAFPVSESLEQETQLKLDLFLKPAKQHILAMGKVVNSEALGDGNYYLRVEFTEITHQDRESLIQHIVQRQGALLSALREQMEE